MEATIPPRKINKTAIVSLVTALLAPLSYCVASWLIADISLDEASRTDVLNYAGYAMGIFLYALAPVILATIALVKGRSALREIEQSSERGKRLAFGGIMIGGLVVAAVLCVVLSFIGIYLTDLFKTSQ